MTAGALFLIRFPITRERHAEVRAALDGRGDEALSGQTSDAERDL
jgi:hypothetical protein